MMDFLNLKKIKELENKNKELEFNCNLLESNNKNLLKTLIIKDELLFLISDILHSDKNISKLKKEEIIEISIRIRMLVNGYSGKLIINDEIDEKEGNLIIKEIKEKILPQIYENYNL